MPTVILLDASLSMLRPVDKGQSSKISNSKRTGFDENESVHDNTSSNETKVYGNTGIELMNLAKWGIDKLLSHFEQSYKLEQVAVLTFSSQCDLAVPFTRDIAEVRGKVLFCYNLINID